MAADKRWRLTADGVYVNFAVARPADRWIEGLAAGGRLVFPLGVPGPQRPNSGGRHSDRGAATAMRRGRSAPYFVRAEGEFEADPEEVERLRVAFDAGGLDTVRSLIWKRPALSDRCWFAGKDWLCLETKRPELSAAIGQHRRRSLGPRHAPKAPSPGEPKKLFARRRGELRRQRAIPNGRRFAAGGRAQVWSRPGEHVRLVADDPGALGVEAQTSLRHGQNLDCGLRIGRRTVRHWRHDRNNAVSIPSGRGDQRARPVLNPLLRAAPMIVRPQIAIRE